MGVAGGELLIPTITLLYAVDVRRRAACRWPCRCPRCWSSPGSPRCSWRQRSSSGGIDQPCELKSITPSALLLPLAGHDREAADVVAALILAAPRGGPVLQARRIAGNS